MQILQVLRSNEQLHVKQRQYAALPHSNGVAIAHMMRCINFVLHAFGATILRTLRTMCSLWTSCLMQALN